MIYYRLDSTKLSFCEYWRWKPGLPFLFLAAKKILGIPIQSGQRYARPEALGTIEPADLPAQHRSVLEPLIAQAKSLGFERRFSYSIPTIGRVSGAAAALAGSDRVSFLLMAHSEPINASRPTPAAFSFFSQDSDGQLLATSGGLPGLVGSAPELQITRVRNGRLEQTWERHCQITGETIGGLVPFRVEELADTILRMLQRNFDYNLDRGVWVPCEDQDYVSIAESKAIGTIECEDPPPTLPGQRKHRA